MEVALLAIIAIFLGLAVFELDQIRTQAPGSPARTASIQKSIKQYTTARGMQTAAAQAETRPATVVYRNPRQRAAEYERTYLEKKRREAKEAANAS